MWEVRQYKSNFNKTFNTGYYDISLINEDNMFSGPYQIFLFSNMQEGVAGLGSGPLEEIWEKGLRIAEVLCGVLNKEEL